MIPVLFKKDEQQFRSYGLGPIHDIINPDVERQRNGQYLLYFQYPHDKEFSSVFEEGMKIKSDAGVRTKWQTFEISRVVRAEGKLIEVFAKHISQSLVKDALNPEVSIRSSTAEQALRTWNNNRIGDESFDVWSNITTTASTNWNIRDISNAFEALAGVEGSILDVWGGEYEFDNKVIRLHREMGRKLPVPLEYGRNITAIEQDEQDDNVFTSIYPFAVYAPDSKAGERREPVTLTIPERYVDGKYLEMHNRRKIQVVDFSGEFDFENPPTVNRLRTLAQQYVETNEVGLPHENLKIEYIDLSKTLDYQEFQTMEEVELNDTLPIFYPKFGVTNENAKVVAINYNPVKEENISIELGVIGQSFRTITTGGINSRLDRVEQQQKETASYVVDASGNRIWSTIPDENMEHKIGDVWFEENGQYTRIRVWNGSQWVIEIDTEDIDKNAKAIEETREQLTEMDDLIEANDEKAQNAYEAATGARDLAESHKQILEELGEDTLRFNHFVDTIDSTVRTIADDEYISQSVQASGIIQNEVSKIEIGGRNLILDSGRERITADYLVASYEPSEYLVEGEEYTVVICVTPAQGVSGFRPYLSSGYNQQTSIPVSGSDKQIITVTFIAHYYNGRTPEDNPSHGILRFYRFPNDGTVNGASTIHWAKIVKGNKTSLDHTLAPEDQKNYTDTAVRTVQTQLDDSWAVQVLNGEDDVLSALNLNSGGVKISGDLVYIDSPEMIADGIITNSLLAGDISADKITVGKLFGNEVTANGINVNTIVGLNSSFLRTTWNGINTAIQIDPEYIRVYGTNNRKAYITPLAEFRSDAANGKYILMGNGRIQAYAPDVGALFILGQDLYNVKPEGQLGVMHRRRFAIGRYDRYSTDEGTPQLNPYIELGFWANQSGYRDRDGMIRIHKPIMFEYRDNITGVGTLNAEQLIVANGGYLRPDTSAGNYLSRLALGGNQGVSFGVMTTNSYNRKAYIDGTHMYMFVTLTMEGRSITNVGSIGPRSERKYKSKIKPLDSVKDTIMGLNFYSYIKRGEFELGIMADEAPKEVMQPGGKAVSLYSYASLFGKGLQEAFTYIEKLELRIKELEGAI